MPIQTFEPMTKDFATFDCDAHVTEPPLIWERAGEFLTRDEMEALRATIWWDNDTQQLIVGGKAGVKVGDVIIEFDGHPVNESSKRKRGSVAIIAGPMMPRYSLRSMILKRSLLTVSSLWAW